MTILHKAGLALIGLAALDWLPRANAFADIDVTPTVTGTTGAFTYSYDVTPLDFDPNVLSFTFSDPNVTFVSVTGPLDTVLSAGPGSFTNFSSTGAALAAGDTETIVFTSPDGPFGTLGVAGTGISGGIAFGGIAPTVIGPAPVPEASTTASLGLLLALGVGGVLVARRKKATAA